MLEEKKAFLHFLLLSTFLVKFSKTIKYMVCKDGLLFNNMLQIKQSSPTFFPIA